MSANKRYFSLSLVFLWVLFAFGIARPARAASVSNTQNIFVSSSIPPGAPYANSCTGGIDTYTATFHAIFNVTVDKNGGLHVSSKVHSSDFKSIDSVVGQCAVQDVGPFDPIFFTTSTFNSNDNSSGADTVTARFSFNEECPGANNNIVVTFLFHETINPDGTVTASFSDFDSACQ